MEIKDWTPIEDGKPNYNPNISDGIGVLIFPKKGDFASSCHFENGKFWFNQVDVTNEISHWTYMPPRPNK